ncbi:MAG: FkbM family methyltransferase [Desulfocapsaceae bacterium]|nr:FkbM family methyltransferase [Desulfocapsaceae bacterium]
MRIEKQIDRETALGLLDEILRRPRAARFTGADRPLALYGAGDLGKMARTYCDRIGRDVDYLVDANAHRLRGSSVWAKDRLFLPEEVPQDRKENDLLAVCIATLPYTPLAESLRKQGWRHLVPFYDLAEVYRDLHPLSNGWMPGALTDADIRELQDVLCSWSDDISRAHHLQFIAWRLLRQDWFFTAAPVTPDDRFFIPEVMQALPAAVSFADVGAHHGKVSLRLFDLIAGRLQKAWLVEADPASLLRLQTAVDTAAPEFGGRVEIIPECVGSRPMTCLFFEGLGYASQVSALGNRQIELTTIDALGISPNFMKLHLEGGELAALEGARKTISANRPVIAATSYHTADGLWRLPRWLLEEMPDYRVMMRLHSWCGTGAVIYALPNAI